MLSTSPLLGSEREKTTPKALANPTYLAAKGSGSLLQECSKRKGHGKTEVKYFQLHTPNMTFLLSLAMPLQVHVTKKPGALVLDLRQGGIGKLINYPSWSDTEG